MKTTNSLTFAVILVFLFGSFNLYATKDEFEFGPYSQDMVLTFDIAPTANWSDFFIKPPMDDPNYGAYFQTRLLFGGGDVSIFNGTYQSGLVANNFAFNTDGTKYNFRITLYENPTSISVEAKEDGAANWIVLFDKAEQAYGYVPAGIVENNPNFLNITNFSASLLTTAGVSEIETDGVKISPNVGGNLLSIISDFELNNADIISETGSIIKKVVLNGSKSSEIDIAGLNRGIYFICLTTKNGKVVKRFIK